MSDLIRAILSRFTGRGKQSQGEDVKARQRATGARFEPITDDNHNGVINNMEEIKENQYKGRVCRVCGSTTRYKASRRCVACKHALSVAEWQRNKIKKENAVNT